MSFKIVITETYTEREMRKSWKPVKSVDGDTEYGYTPEIEVNVVKDRKILEQEVESLDLPAVIKAVNGL